MVSRNFNSRVILRPPSTLFHLFFFLLQSPSSSRYEACLRPPLCASYGLKFLREQSWVRQACLGGGSSFAIAKVIVGKILWAVWVAYCTVSVSWGSIFFSSLHFSHHFSFFLAWDPGEWFLRFFHNWLFTTRFTNQHSTNLPPTCHSSFTTP